MLDKPTFAEWEAEAERWGLRRVGRELVARARVVAELIGSMSARGTPALWWVVVSALMASPTGKGTLSRQCGRCSLNGTRSAKSSPDSARRPSDSKAAPASSDQPSKSKAATTSAQAAAIWRAVIEATGSLAHDYLCRAAGLAPCRVWPPPATDGGLSSQGGGPPCVRLPRECAGAVVFRLESAQGELQAVQLEGLDGHGRRLRPQRFRRNFGPLTGALFRVDVDRPSGCGGGRRAG